MIKNHKFVTLVVILPLVMMLTTTPASERCRAIRSHPG